MTDQVGFRGVGVAISDQRGHLALLGGQFHDRVTAAAQAHYLA
jgi:hypothetical protein